MKKTLMAFAFCSALLAGCKGVQLGGGNDDVYVNPAEEKRLKQLAREEQARKAAEENRKREEETAQRKAAENSNSYYKDPEYNSDDYYDYEYAARINRFHQPIYGAGYYDPFYTNMYTYNQNPAFWGTSIYTGYTWGMPSTMFNGYSMGISTGWGYGMNRGCWSCYPTAFYDPFWSPYGMGYYDPWYQPWGYGGYYNSYNNGWNQGYMAGYYNRLDANSGYSRVNVGPRSSTGSNTGRATSESESASGRYMQSVAEEQARNQRFTPVENRSQSRGRIQSAPSETGRSSTGGTQPPKQEPARVEPGRRSSSSGRIKEGGNERGRQRSNDTWEQPAPAQHQGRDRGSERPSQPRNTTGGNTRPRG
jgi:hypothetical protein